MQHRWGCGDSIGKGPSLVAPAIVTAMLLVFLALWIYSTSMMSMGAMGAMFLLFGVLVVTLGIYSVFKNYFDVRESMKSADKPDDAEHEKGPYTGYCPYCGSPVKEDYHHCRVCGKRL